MGSTVISDIVAIVRVRTGLDLALYREPTLERRIRNRMTTLGISTPEDYVRHLEQAQPEAEQLLQRVTIKVSRFYRHRPTFDLLRRQLFPRLAALGRPARLWSAGCGCGEEAYTLAMLLDEAGVTGCVEATDVDAAALARARAGLYGEAAITELPPELAGRYLEAVETERPRWRVAPALARRVRFSRSDVTRPGAVPPAAPFDLVCCRNVLIYWRPEAQARLLGNLLDALAPQGLLCLGEAEWPHVSLTAVCTPIAPNARVFRVGERKELAA